ncbi:MAG: ribonuclease H-like domain-containing protein, partial [Thermoleophilia bacterium]|nr:ribonuclease H-like domain-containing protein [Thermoleophilia bacterium]
PLRVKPRIRGKPIALYLDIETRAVHGLSYDRQYITVIGFYHEDTGLRQLVWPDITAETLKSSLPQANHVYTFNGNGFDLKVIHRHLGLNLLDFYKSRDLMYDCWSCGLKGGLKAVEKRLGIRRTQPPLDNIQIQNCWTRWKHRGDRDALAMLLKYNEEDVLNLVELRNHLGV